MKINTVMLAGAGAVGLPIAEVIYKYDADCISILAKGERLERYRRNGLKVNGEKLNFKFNNGEIVDLIIVACKYHHLDQIIEDITPSVGKDTIILSLLNGISSEEIIGCKLGRERLPLAMIRGTDAFHQGEETTYKNRGVVHFGSEGINGQREQSIAEFFTRTGVTFKLEENMRRALWSKYLFNVGLNQVTGILRLPYKALHKMGGNDEIPEACSLMEKAMREVISIANAEGIDLNEGDIENCYKTLSVLDPQGYSSMCQDILAGRKTEVEMFSLAVMELGKKHNIPVPVNEILFLLLRSIEKSQGNI
jgi:2-dehydropantoate 2-reductase